MNETTLQLFPALPTPIEDALRASIERFGVLVPVVKDQTGRILDGHHRSRIATELGVTFRVDTVRVRDEEEAREIQRTLNSDRRQLTEEQRQEVAVALRRDGHSIRAIAGALGVGKSTIDRDLDEAREIVPPGTIEEPERVIRRGGGTYPARRPTIVPGKDNRAAERAQQAFAVLPPEAETPPVLDVREVQRAAARHQREELSVEPVPVPTDGYRCIVIDPPWPMEKLEREVRPNQGPVLDYPTLEISCQESELLEHDCKRGDTWTTCWEGAELTWGDGEEPSICQSIQCVVGHVLNRCALEDGCHVYLWTTHRFLPDAFGLFKGWGVNYECLLTWAKNVGFTPFSWMYDTEHVLFGRIGKLDVQRKGLRLAFNAPVIGHSAKPDVFYERVREASPEPRLEMFARAPHDGFAAWGNEVAGND